MGSEEYNPFARMDNRSVSVAEEKPGESIESPLEELNLNGTEDVAKDEVEQMTAEAETEAPQPKKSEPPAIPPKTYKQPSNDVVDTSQNDTASPALDTTPSITTSTPVLPDPVQQNPTQQQQPATQKQTTTQKPSRVPIIAPAVQSNTVQAEGTQDKTRGVATVGYETDARVAGGEDSGQGGIGLSGDEFWNEHEQWKASVLSKPFTIRVHDPRQAERSLMSPKPPWMYLISCETLGSNVRRRYSDFEWLHSALKQRFVGIVIPPLPEKKVAGNFSNHAFIQSRMRGLSQFLSRVIENPYLRCDYNTTFFLTASDAQWAHKQIDKSQTIGQERWIQALGQYKLPEKYKLHLLALGSRVDNLESTLRSLISCVSKLANASMLYCTALRDMRLKFNELKSNGVLSDEDKAKIGIKLNKEFKIIDETVAAWLEQNTSHPALLEQRFLEVLKYEFYCLKELKTLLQERFNVLKLHEKGKQQLQQLENEKRTAEMTGRLDKVPRLELKLGEARNVVDSTKRHFGFITQGLFYSQIDNFENRKVQALKQMMVNLSTALIEHHTSMTSVFEADVERQSQ